MAPARACDTTDDAPRAAPSKSQRKREALELRSLAESLVDLGSARLAGVPIDEAVAAAVAAARGLERTARKRQIGYVARLLRERDAEPVRAALGRLAASDAAGSAAHHRLERWRARLIEEGDAALEALVAEHPEVERSRVRRLVRAARGHSPGEPPGERARRAARDLFRYLREIAGP